MLVSCSKKEAALHGRVEPQANKIYVIFIVALSGSAIEDGVKKKKFIPSEVTQTEEDKHGMYSRISGY